MGIPQDKARQLARALRNAGISCYFNESQANLFPQMAAVEATIGIPNVLPPQADGDVLIQFHSSLGGKLSSDIINVPWGKETDAIIACNNSNSIARYIRLYYEPSARVIVADYDFNYWDASYCDRVISALREMKEVVNSAYPMLRRAIG